MIFKSKLSVYNVKYTEYGSWIALVMRYDFWLTTLFGLETTGIDTLNDWAHAANTHSILLLFFFRIQFCPLFFQSQIVVFCLLFAVKWGKLIRLTWKLEKISGKTTADIETTHNTDEIGRVNFFLRFPCQRQPHVQVIPIHCYVNEMRP